MFGGFTNNSSADFLRLPLNTTDSQTISPVISQSSPSTNENTGSLFQGFRSNSGLNGNDIDIDFVGTQQQQAPPPTPGRRFVLTGPSDPLPGQGNRTGPNNPLSSANRSGPRYPEYALKAVRRTSFRSWSATLKPAEILAEAGFYSTNNGDCVRCFYCGIGLRNWDPDDDPWVEHARWSSKCPYLRDKKGIEFVNLVQAAVRQADIEEALQQNTQSNNGIRNTPGDLEADQELPKSGTQMHNGQSKSYRPNPTEKKNPLLCPAAQSALEMGYLPKIVKRAVDQILESKGWDGMTAMNILEVLLEMEEREKQKENGVAERMLVKDKPSLPIPEPVEQFSSDKSGLKDRLRTENSELKERTTCKICCESIVSIVFLPCGHLVCCAQCSPALKDCPVCRSTVKGTVRICLS